MCWTVYAWSTSSLDVWDIKIMFWLTQFSVWVHTCPFTFKCSNSIVKHINFMLWNFHTILIHEVFGKKINSLHLYGIHIIYTALYIFTQKMNFESVIHWSHKLTQKLVSQTKWLLQYLKWTVCIKSVVLLVLLQSLHGSSY